MSRVTIHLSSRTRETPMKNLLHRFARWLLRKTAPDYLPMGTANFLDAHASRRQPTVNDLLNELKNTAWTCASINASVCASLPPRLYVATSRSQGPPRCATRTLEPAMVRQLRATRPSLVPQTIEEVVDHPLLTLFARSIRCTTASICG